MMAEADGVEVVESLEELVELIGNWWEQPGASPAPVICSYHPETREYLRTGRADPSPLEPGVWLLPGHSAQLEAPEVVAGLAPVLSNDGSSWEQVADLRGRIAYVKETAKAVEVTALGPLDEACTFKAPGTPIDTWQDGKWAPDSEALKAHNAQRKTLLAQYATQQISTLQRAADLGMATAAEEELLTSWQKYSVLLNRVDVSAALAADAWPEVPDPAGAAAWLISKGFDGSY